ncbi:MAG: hypothetical protein ACI4E2_07280 [Acetatifactor sp.]
MVFYLKLNRLMDYSIRNMQVWINAISLYEDAIVYVLCDNEKLIERICNEVDFHNIEPSFLKSIKRDCDRELIEVISVPRWHNAAYAHLTPFIHAKQNQYRYFWNIDADDTMFALSAERLKESLVNVEKYAEENDIDLFSLDMWRSRSYAMHWSFGITFTNGCVDWFSIMKEYTDYTNGSEYFINGNRPKNIDEYFTYIKASDKHLRIETFYIENLLFLHYSDDFVMNPITSGIYKWKKGKLTFPIIKNIYGVDSLGEIEIAKDVIQFDFDIQDFEAGWALAEVAPFSLEVTNIIEASEFKKLRDERMEKNIETYVEREWFSLQSYKHIFIFGFGNYTGFLIDLLKAKGIKTTSILDNAKFKWGGSINGVVVESPDTLNIFELQEVCVLIDVRHFEAIRNQLIKIGIKETQIYQVVDYSEV